MAVASVTHDSTRSTSPGLISFLYRCVSVVTSFGVCDASYQYSSSFSRLIEPFEVFLILNVVMISLPTNFDWTVKCVTFAPCESAAPGPPPRSSR